MRVMRSLTGRRRPLHRRHAMTRLAGMTACALLAAVAAPGNLRADNPLARIGQWDGKTETAALQGPYEDRLQQEIPFGRRSFDLAPWRAYMDTWPAARFLECLGANSTVGDQEADATATVLSEAGIRSVRVEIGWGGFSYDDPTRQPEAAAKRTSARLQALQQHGIRPLIVLNAHHGIPCPMKGMVVTVAADAAAGSRKVTLRDVRGIRPGYSGLSGLSGRYLAAEVIVTAVDASNGTCTLSCPLPKAVKRGQNVQAVTLKFQPFSGAVFADGTPNPAAQETLDGWMMYVAGICALARQALGTAGAADAGFDLEVWNEYTFGSNFLSDKNYYDPPRKYREPVRYSRHGLTCEGVESILPMTVDFVNDPTNRLAGVNVISGFANQRPWENGVDMWPGQAGFSRHYYTGITVKPLTPETDHQPGSGLIDALGNADGKPSGKGESQIVPGSAFIPTLNLSLPELHQLAIQTEFMTRDLQPFPGPWPRHGRYGNPGTGRCAQVWMTEFNCCRSDWAKELMAVAGCSREDPRLDALMHHVAAKATLRAFVFHSHKGVHTINLFADKKDDTAFGLINDAFFTLLATNHFALTDSVRAQAGLQIATLGRVTKLMRQGKALDVTRPLSVTALVEHQPRLVFAGNGTPAHPDRFQRDDFACLPFQLDADRYAVGYYVVTRNIAQTWDADRDILDARRYAMPEQTFDLTLANVRGEGCAVSAWDPITDQTQPVKVLAATRTTLTVQLPTLDYPRFLLIHERAAGPQLLDLRLRERSDGLAELTFRTATPLAAQVTWGPLPSRSAAGVTNLPAALEHRCVLPRPGVNQGVRVIVQADGLVVPWPRWDDDVAGMLAWPKPGQAKTPASVRFPELPVGLRPQSYALQPSSRIWVMQGERQTLSLAGAIDVTLEKTQLEPAAMLPERSVLDRCEIKRITWGAAAAWQVDLTLDAVAHPDLAQTRQRAILAPMMDGLLVVSFKGTEPAFAAHKAEIDGLLHDLATGFGK